MRPVPRSVALLGRLLPATAVAGLLEIIIGVVQTRRLDANSAAATVLTPFGTDVERAIANLQSSATICLWAGAATLLLAGTRFLVLRALPKATLAVWALWGVVLIGQLLLVGDASIGLTAYTDAAGDLAREDTINSLLLMPGRWILLVPAEIAALGLLTWIFILMRGEDTIEHLRSRTEAEADPAWDAMMAARRNTAASD